MIAKVITSSSTTTVLLK